MILVIRINERSAKIEGWYRTDGSFARITRMQNAALESMKRRIGFGDSDTVLIARLAPCAETIVPRVVHRFYDQILADPSAVAIFTGGEEQLARQRVVLGTWLSRVLTGRFGAEHFEASLRIGEAHVRAGLGQHHMLLGMQLIWRELDTIIQELKLDDGAKIASALHKLLMLDLTTMLESYKECYAQKVRSNERIAVEEKLTRAEHLAEIGQLAASLAHEIKNPLAGISGAIQIMRDSMGEDDPHRPIALEIMEQIKRLDATVKDLLQYARPIPPRFGRVNLDETVSHVLSVVSLEPAIRGIRLYGPTSADDHCVGGDEGQLQQLIMNLIINAAHASKDGSEVSVTLTRRDGTVRLVVEDEGGGMTPEVVAQAFDAFFTTKAKGTGLGLSICRRIVESHGGRMELDSEPGRGTCVIVDLPAAEPPGGIDAS